MNSLFSFVIAIIALLFLVYLIVFGKLLFIQKLFFRYCGNWNLTKNIFVFIDSKKMVVGYFDPDYGESIIPKKILKKLLHLC